MFKDRLLSRDWNFASWKKKKKKEKKTQKK